MDASQIERVARQALPLMLEKLSLQHWDIRIDVEHIGTGAAVCIYPHYERAEITFCTEQKSERLIQEALWHELLHVMHGEFEHPRDMCQKVMPKKQMRLFDMQFRAAAEKTVRRMQRVIGFDQVFPDGL